ncbi:hypothetical protein [Aquimarina algiphila]|uniref:hypothetical protein n=1 Tax=Aquimarina algiphila TaxID=2047982 RepID=UPI00232B63F4|nr:hypothetical protein [Aquimarina algiphila]
MKLYFILLFKRLNRHLKDFGIEPLIAYLIIPGLFYLGSTSFFDKVMYPNYFYMLIGIVTVFIIRYPKHDELIKQHFLLTDFKSIVVINHILLAIPFILFLVFRMYYEEALIVFGMTIFISFIKKPGKFNLTLPTPFFRWPFEFVIGFRKTFWMFLLSYGIAIISINVNNFNLGIFSILSIFFICSMYYSKPDPQFYIWIHDMNPQGFLKHKISIASKYSIVLTFPIFLILSISYIDQMHIALIFSFLGLLYMIMYIVIKYAFLRDGVGMFQGIIGVLCILFPPAMLIVIPYFYFKAQRNLNSLLK